MKMVKWIAVAALGLVAGFGLASWMNAKTNAERAKESDALRSSLTEARQAEDKAGAQRDRWQAEAERLRQESAEVHRLRSEVARLNRESEQKVAAAERRALEVAQRNVTQAPAQVLKKEEAGSGAIPLESAPPQVQASILRELGNVPVNGIFARNSEGKLSYGTKGQLPDGRGIALRVDQNGSVLEKNTEISTEAVPAPVQTAVTQLFGDLGTGRPREIIEGDTVRYEFAAKRPDAVMEMSVRNDGTVLSYANRWRPAGEPRGKK